MLKDFLGREIQLGDMVVYPGRQSSSLWMNAGTVEGFKYTEVVDAESFISGIKVRVRAASGWRKGTAGREKLVTLTATDNVVVVGRA